MLIEIPDALRDLIAQAIGSVGHEPGGGPCELCVETADAVVEALADADPSDLGYELVCLVPEPGGHGNCRTKPCRSMRCPAEIDRLPLEELRRFAHRQRQLIEAFRRQHNYHLNCIQDLEQQIKTLKSKTEMGPPPCTPAAARDAIENARRKVMDLYGGNLDHPALYHLEAALCAVEDIERDRG